MKEGVTLHLEVSGVTPRGRKRGCLLNVLTLGTKGFFFIIWSLIQLQKGFSKRLLYLSYNFVHFFSNSIPTFIHLLPPRHCPPTRGQALLDPSQDCHESSKGPEEGPATAHGATKPGHKGLGADAETGPGY